MIIGGFALGVGALVTKVLENTLTAHPFPYKLNTTGIFSFIEVYGNATPVATATGPKYQHFDNTPIQQRKQMYNSFGGQMVIFG